MGVGSLYILLLLLLLNGSPSSVLKMNLILSFAFDEMDYYSLEENWQMLKIYFQSGESSIQTVQN